MFVWGRHAGSALWERRPRRDAPLWPTSIRPEGEAPTKNINHDKVSTAACYAYSPVRAR
jgi:hypothetical protein